MIWFPICAIWAADSPLEAGANAAAMDNVLNGGDGANMGGRQLQRLAAQVADASSLPFLFNNACDAMVDHKPKCAAVVLRRQRKDVQSLRPRGRPVAPARR